MLTLLSIYVPLFRQLHANNATVAVYRIPPTIFLFRLTLSGILITPRPLPKGREIAVSGIGQCGEDNVVTYA